MITAPTITATVKDINSATIALTGDEFTLVRYRSTARATMTPTAYNGATIQKDLSIIKNSGETIRGTYTHDFTYVTDNVFRFSVEDSNGSYRQEIKQPDLIPYIELTCEMSNSRPDANGDMRLSCTGDYYNNTFGAVSNTLTVKYQYAKDGGSYSSLESMTVTKSGNSYSAYADLTGLDYQASYTFRIQAEDKLTITSTSEAGMRTLPLFHWSYNDFVFEVPVKFNAGFPDINNDLTVYGNLRLKKDDESYGSYLRFGDNSYCYIAEKNDDEMTLKADVIDLQAEELKFNGENVALPEYGLWTPELSSDAVNYYSTRHGWYSRAGYVVTVGFYIKARCYSDYEDTDITIEGLPFMPEYSASGGGICSGAYIPAGLSFQGYVAEDSAYEITVRVQDCDRENDENIGTSASGCRYPVDGGTITLSGTITYVTLD